MLILAVDVLAAASIGTVLEYSVATTNSQLVSIVAGPDGNLWFTQRGSVAQPWQQGLAYHARGRDYRVHTAQSGQPAARG